MYLAKFPLDFHYYIYSLNNVEVFYSKKAQHNKQNDPCGPFY